ncbi:hypothetical protein [Gemmatimonas sp.]|uniref:hypothetical protein n=1 Tax=Gemmatimonas sp. TaxID=1962908 RepID=UPI003563EDBC
MSASDNILIGPARLFVAPAGTIFPDTEAEVASLKAGTLLGWTTAEVGHTTRGSALSVSPTQVAVGSQQSALPLMHYNRGFDVKLTTAALEVTLTNLRRAMHGAGMASVTAGVQGQSVAYAICMVGPWHAADASEALLTIQRAVFSGSSELTSDAENAAEVAIELTVLQAATGAAWELIPVDDLV